MANDPSMATPIVDTSAMAAVVLASNSSPAPTR